jgi:hypothetical protein
MQHIDITFSRIPIKFSKPGYSNRLYKEMAKRMAKLHQGADNKTILPVSRRKVEEKD